jgi:tRNA 2-thiouridine synthesizing protein A
MEPRIAAVAMVLDNRGLEPPQPMMRILEALEELPDNATLLAINEREPLFLYPELAARGYCYTTTPHPDGSFHITIGREVAAEASEPPLSSSDAGMHRKTVVVDVRDDQRRRKEPFARIMAAVQALRPDEDLLLINSFEPVPLYTVLGRQGFSHTTTQLGPEEWRVRFVRDGTGQ